jgi:MFS family permease
MFNKDEVFHKGMEREMVLLFIAIAFIGSSQGFSENILTNFYSIIGMQTGDRTLLEPIRELPGLLIMFIIAVLSVLTISRMAATAMILRAAGFILVACFTQTFDAAFIGFLVITSLGDHIFMPLRNTIGIIVANPGYEGRVIGLMDAAATVMFTVASLPVLFVFNGKEIRDYKLLFFLTAICALLAGTALFLMRTRKPAENVSKPRLVFKKKYTLYYFISFISGMRKIVYGVFVPWLLVKTFSAPVQTMTLLSMTGAVTVFFFNPFIGHLIDKYGERKFLIGGGAICVIIYSVYAVLSTQNTNNSIILFVLLALSYFDRLTQSTLMGRDIFVKHTAESTDEIMPTLSAGVSMDHIASVIAPIFGGMLWVKAGAQWVFVAGAVIGVLFTLACSLVPDKNRENMPENIPA